MPSTWRDLPLTCGQCFVRYICRIVTVEGIEDQPECPQCGPTSWMALPDIDGGAILRDELEQIRRAASEARPSGNGTFHYVPISNSEAMRRYWDRYLDRDEDSPERQPWWGDFDS